MSDIEVLRAEVDRLTKELRGASRRLNEAQIAASPFAVGDVLEFRRGGAWTEGIVREIEPKSWDDGYWFVVSRRTKSGEWSRSTMRTFAYRPVPEATP